MVGPGIAARVDALEQSLAPKFSGFASVNVFRGMTSDQAVADWEAENGPVGSRQVILWNFGGLNHATA